MKPLGNPVFRQSSGFRQILHVLHASMAWRTPKWSPSPIGAARAAATRAAAPLPAKSANFHTKLSQLQWQLPEASVHARHLLNLFWTVKELFFWEMSTPSMPHCSRVPTTVPPPSQRELSSLVLIPIRIPMTCRDMLWLSVPYVFSYVFWIFTFFQRFDNALNISSRQISCRSKISYLGSRKKNILLQFIT